MRTVFLDYATVSKSDLDTSRLRDAIGGTADDLQLFDATDDAVIRARIERAEIVLLNKFVLTREHLIAAPALKLIALAATGTDNVDLAAAQERGVAVCNVRGYCTMSVVQHVWGMILSLTQHLTEYRRLANDGSWVRSEQFTVLAHPIRELTGLTLGIVGWGELGRGVAKVADAFGMRVIIAQRRGGPAPSDAASDAARGVPPPGDARAAPGRVELSELLRQADIVSLHCPLTDATRGMIGAQQLALMKPDALLINTARGGLVDGSALAAALKAGKLGGAGIDALPREPPVEGDPLLDAEIPNLILTPHVAWAAREARQRCVDEIAANIQDFKSGGRRARVV